MNARDYRVTMLSELRAAIIELRATAVSPGDPAARDVLLAVTAPGWLPAHLDTRSARRGAGGAQPTHRTPGTESTRLTGR
jgi:hypothetical protein